MCVRHKQAFKKNKNEKEKKGNMPLHLLTTEDAEILKNVVLHSVATAFASIVCNNQTKIYDYSTKQSVHAHTTF